MSKKDHQGKDDDKHDEKHKKHHADEPAKKEKLDKVDATAKKEVVELHPLETVTSLLLIRHGHTEATERGLLYSDANIELTDRGVEQAKLAAKWAANFKPDMILTGKAKRVVQSAQPLAKLTGLKPQAIAGFEEWQVGKWEGRTYLDIKKNDPEQYQKWCADPINNAPPGGESIDDLVQRIGHHLLHLVRNEEYRGKKIALVTHSGIIRSIIVQALDMPVGNFWRLAIPTGSVSRVNFSPNFALLQFCGLTPEGPR